MIAWTGFAEVDETSAPTRARSRRYRLAAAVIIGLASALFAAFSFTQQTPSPDFNAWYYAAHALISGANPYHLQLGSAAWPFDEPFYYPLPAVIVTLPFAALSLPVAGAFFIGLSGGLLAWLVSRDGFWRLWLFGTASYFMACRLGQWSPLITAVALLPAVGFLAAMKPNLGLAALAYRTTWGATLGCVAVGLLSFAILPTWLADWHANLSSLIAHPAPVATTGGPILLLAVLRWRRPEARLLLVMACVPQLLFWADQLPLFLVPRTKGEMKALVLWSALSFFVWYIWFAPYPAYLFSREPFVLCSIYLPCLILVLRRPNEGDVPAWLEQRLARMRGDRSDRAP